MEVKHLLGILGLSSPFPTCGCFMMFHVRSAPICSWRSSGQSWSQVIRFCSMPHTSAQRDPLCVSSISSMPHMPHKRDTRDFHPHNLMLTGASTWCTKSFLVEVVRIRPILHVAMFSPGKQSRNTRGSTPSLRCCQAVWLWASTAHPMLHSSYPYPTLRTHGGDDSIFGYFLYT